MRALWRTFRLPLLIAGLSLTGLVWALLADGATDLAASALAGAPLLSLAWLRAKRG